MDSHQIRQKYLDFFVKKGHVLIPASPLVPDEDPTVLFTTAGMHPLVPYLLGQPHPAGKRLVNFQKCVRTDDIDEVGDTSHHTFFEMLGNWSLGDYFKNDAITWSYEFLTKELSLNPDRLYITCFEGDENAPKDEESARIWMSLGVPREKIFFYGKKDNWWGPAGQTGPCGPDTEMYYDLTQIPHGSDCAPGCACGRFSEIWNDVFMEYNKTSAGKMEKLSKPNVDTGMGLERTTAVINNLDDNYKTDIFSPVIDCISRESGGSYSQNKKPFRIIADHLRAAVFIISDGVIPSNKERGYVLRRLLRRASVQMHRLKMDPALSSQDLINVIIDGGSRWYPDLSNQKELITQVISTEISKFQLTLDRGLKEFAKMDPRDGKSAFNLFQSFGFPLELTLELALEKGITLDKSEFEKEFHKHQELSRTASAGKFKGGLADNSETVTKYHTATHLLHRALREVLGQSVTQAGSNITGKRLRFDFTHPAKLTPDQIQRVEDLVNQKIKENLPVFREEISKQLALKEGALAFFPQKYPEITTMYTIGPKDAWFSKELCGGPHVGSTGSIGHIKISKEEKVGSGVRRIYAVLN